MILVRCLKAVPGIVDKQTAIVFIIMAVQLLGQAKKYTRKKIIVGCYLVLCSEEIMKFGGGGQEFQISSILLHSQRKT